MKKQYHILNGDSLKEQFPQSIEGELIVTRECLVEGNVKGKNLDELFHNRAKFLSATYGGTEQEYFEKVVPEFTKILNIEGAEINLWFEDDLFCQANFWFVTSLLNQSKNRVCLIRPMKHTQYGFAGLNEAELMSIYNNRSELIELGEISRLWELYKSNNIELMLETATELKGIYPFILTAVEAHIQRMPQGDKLGRPTESLIAIMDELKTSEFGPIFREFCKREYIYGFGDLQVKRLFDQIKR